MLVNRLTGGFLFTKLKRLTYHIPIFTFIALASITGELNLANANPKEEQRKAALLETFKSPPVRSSRIGTPPYAGSVIHSNCRRLGFRPKEAKDTDCYQRVLGIIEGLIASQRDSKAPTPNLSKIYADYELWTEYKNQRLSGYQRHFKKMVNSLGFCVHGSIRNYDTFGVDQWFVTRLSAHRYFDAIEEVIASDIHVDWKNLPVAEFVYQVLRIYYPPDAQCISSYGVRQK
jgi:hypothetical protein